MANNRFGKKWSYEEVVLALYAYCHVPFNKASNNNPWILRIASIIGRTPASVKMKIGNLGAFDPSLKEKGISGLTGTSKMDEQVWRDYYGRWDKLVIDAEKIIANYDLSQANEVLTLPKGTEQYYRAKRRLNQSFFRSAVLSSYGSQCCVTGIKEPKLLEACHIKSWSEDEELRTDPSNGLCLNSLLHSAYDNLLITVSPDFKVVFSDEFIFSCGDKALKDYFVAKNQTTIYLPNRFYPYQHCLEEHYGRFINKI